MPAKPKPKPQRSALRRAAAYPVDNHPNATVAASLSALSAGGVASADWLGQQISPTLAIALSGGLTTLGLAIGRRGIRGLLQTLWKGTEP